MTDTLRAAVIQAASVPFDSTACVTKAVALMGEAAAMGAKLAVFPEAFVSAYPKGADFGAVVGMRTAEGREDFRRYHASAITLPGPELDRLCEGARAAGLYVVIGVIERDGGTLYCTAVHLGPDGSYLGKHRKLMPTAAERLVWGFGDGSTLPAIPTPFGVIGSVICWENYMPLLRAAMFAKGVQFYCTPTADDRDTWVASMRHIALEGRCFVLSACQHIRRSAYPADYASNFPADRGDTVMMRGGSLIVDPLGTVLAGPDYDGETILIADCDLGQLARGKYDFDVTGHYARPDVLRLIVDETPKPAVVFHRASLDE